VRVWTKLTLGFAATATVIVGVYGSFQLRQEADDLRSAAERDLRVTGTAVQVGVVHALRDGHTGDVRAVIDAVRLRDASLDVLVFDETGALTAGSRTNPGIEGDVRRLVRDTQATNHASVQFEGPLGLSYAIATFPIQDGDGVRVGTLALARSLDEAERDLESEARQTILALATLVVGLVVAGWCLASVYVRRPLLELVHAMSAVRAGNLSAKAALQRPDEMGAAVSEFNAMTADLLEARQRLIAEADAREALETNLQRADKLITVGQLSAGLAHEIGSPLLVLNGRARAIAARTDVPAEVCRSAQILADESDRITRIVDQLLTFSRHTVPAISVTALAVPVRDIVELYEPEARRHDVRLEFSCDEALAEANADAGQVQQVVMNLLSNAVRATRPGGHIRVALRGSTFSRGGGEPQASVALTVEDTGEGIPEPLLARIFEPFFTTRPQTGGTGLGLAVVKSIVDAHGGSIAVSTAPGQGTLFTVHFPVARSAVVGGRVA